MQVKKFDWLCCQYGSREYYAIPRALCQNNVSAGLVTDLWINPSTFLNHFIPAQIKRYHSGLRQEQVKSFNYKFLARKTLDRLYKDHEDESGKKFEKIAASWIRKKSELLDTDVVFSYSYGALDFFKVAKSLGVVTVSGQINPGPEEAKIVEEAFKEEFGGRHKPTVPDQAYWERWYRECELADHIIVNSRWSEKLIQKAGIPYDKIGVIPLIFDTPPEHEFRKSYPRVFSRERPLRILYLGSISVRKGFHLLRKAMKEITSEPVILDLVGTLIGPEELIWNMPPNIIYHGRKGQKEKTQLYQDADVFILPTLSDGFAITQLEAQYWKLPLIVSDRCGEVVKNNVNGIVLKDLSTGSIVNAISSLLDQPELLSMFSENVISMENYSLEAIGKKWIDVVK